MPKLKTPRAAEPNKPGCLKYGATVFCALGASIYLIIALTGYGLTDTSVRPLLFVLSGIMIAVIIIIWRPWSKKAAEHQISSEISPSDKMSEDLIPIQVPEDDRDESPVSYISNGRTTWRADGKELTDDDVAYLRQASYEKAHQYYENSPNPKFHRSFEENMAMGRFYAANEEYIRKLENDIWLPHLYDFNSLDEAILHAQKALISAQQLAEYCSKTSIGQQYFEDMWLHAHNSRYPDFSIIDKIKERYKDLTLNYEERKHDFAVHKKRQAFLQIADDEVLKVIQDNPAILQKDLHKQFDPDLKPTIGTAVSHLVKADKITRIKHGSTYELYPK